MPDLPRDPCSVPQYSRIRKEQHTIKVLQRICMQLCLILQRGNFFYVLFICKSPVCPVQPQGPRVPRQCRRNHGASGLSGHSRHSRIRDLLAAFIQYFHKIRPGVAVLQRTKRTIYVMICSFRERILGQIFFESVIPKIHMLILCSMHSASFYRLLSNRTIT